jgi:hypothetical protein
MYVNVISDNRDGLSLDEMSQKILQLLVALRRLVLSGDIEYVTTVGWLLAAMASSSNRSSSSSSSIMSPFSFFRRHIMSAIQSSIQ